MTHAPTIRRLFALEHAFRPRPPMPPGLVDRALPAAGQITLITGPSGGGKSSLLTAVRERLHTAGSDPQPYWIEPSQIRLPDACVIDCMCRVLGDEPASIERALDLLGRVGLAEAWTYLQKPAELSDGQRWRLMLAIAVATAACRGTPGNASMVTAIIAMDEFAALLDRITARVVARALRRLIRPSPADAAAPRLAAIVATSHDDLSDALSPDTVVTCDFDAYAVQAQSK